MPVTTIATLEVAAHLLTEAGSAVARALDLLELADWPEEDGPMIGDALRGANRGISGVRMLVDGHTADMLARARGQASAAPTTIAAARDLVRDEVAQ